MTVCIFNVNVRCLAVIYLKCLQCQGYGSSISELSISGHHCSLLQQC